MNNSVLYVRPRRYWSTVAHVRLCLPFETNRSTVQCIESHTQSITFRRVQRNKMRYPWGSVQPVRWNVTNMFGFVQNSFDSLSLHVPTCRTIYPSPSAWLRSSHRSSTNVLNMSFVTGSYKPYHPVDADRERPDQQAPCLQELSLLANATVKITHDRRGPIQKDLLLWTFSVRFTN